MAALSEMLTFKNSFRFCGRGLRLFLFLGFALWSILAVYYSNLPTPALRSVGATGCTLILAGIVWKIRPWRITRLALLAVYVVVLVWFLLIPPSNNRDWQPDVAVLPSAEVNGGLVTIRNIRNCDYRSELDYTVRHYDKTFDLAKLRTVDFYVVYWGSPWIAHTMLSFGFEGGDYVCFSIETRKEKGEAYSAIQGFFRRYELTYVIGDERDLVRLRTNFRGEQVYLYRLNGDIEVARAVFLDYLAAVNRLKERPEWYNALTSNCTTNIRGHTKPYARNARFDWRILVNGRVDQMAYERGTLDKTMPFEDLKAHSLINERAKAADSDPAFSARIREGLPGVSEAVNSARIDRSPDSLNN